MTFNLPNFTQERFVVEHYQSSNQWYRIYNDGWIEQGNVWTNSNTSAATNKTINLNKSFSNTNYTVVRMPIWGNSGSAANNDWYSIGILSKTTSNFVINTHTNTVASSIIWYACGQGSTPTIKLRRCIKY